MDGVEDKKRKVERLPIAVGGSITLRGWPLIHHAVTLNVSPSGALIRFEEPIELEVGDMVTCDFAVADGELRRRALPIWARGEVLRVEGTDVALRLVDTSFGVSGSRGMAA
jgi:hypothetical protein